MTVRLQFMMSLHYKVMERAAFNQAKQLFIMPPPRQRHPVCTLQHTLTVRERTGTETRRLVVCNTPLLGHVCDLA